MYPIYKIFQEDKMALDYGKAKSILSSSFLENNEGVSEDEASNLVVKAELTIKGLRQEKSEDEQLIAATQVKKDLESAFNNAIRYEEAKIQYLLAKIEEIQEGDVNPHASV
jgi:hypothetical protein